MKNWQSLYIEKKFIKPYNPLQDWRISTGCRAIRIPLLIFLLLLVPAAFAEDLSGNIGYLDPSANLGLIEVIPTDTPLPQETDSDQIGLPLSAIVPGPPVALFSADPVSGTAPLTVRFTDQSSGNPVQWAWDFGDGNTGSSQSMSNIYNNPGTYTVLLVVYNEAGWSEYSQVISVSPPPSPIPTPAPQEGIGYLPTPTPQEGIGYLPTPTPEPSLPKATLTPAMASLKNPIPTPDPSSTTADPDILKKRPPSADFTYSQGDGSSLMAVRFYDTSAGNPTAWNWDFGDGLTSSKQNPIHTYAKSGRYDVFLDASNEYGIDQKYAEVGVIDKPDQPIAKFIAEPTSGPVPLTVKFTDLSEFGPIKYDWNFGDGTLSTMRNPVHTYSQQGSYWVSLTVSNISPYTKKMVSNDYVKEITVTGPMKASFIASPTDGYIPLTVTFTDTSTGSPVGWNWDFGDGSTSTEQNPVHTYTVLNTKGYTPTLTISAPDGRSDTAAETITTRIPGPPGVSFTEFSYTDTLPIMYGFQDQSTKSPTSWYWDFGDGGYSFDQHPVHSYTKEGDYTVTLSAGNADGISMANKVISVREAKG